MINTLDIGKYIHSVLTDASSGITCKCNPLVADNDTKYPFIVYRRMNLVSSTCKDGVFQDDVVMEIIVVSNKYSESVEIATKIRKRLERQRVIYNDLEINDGNIIMATEEFSNNAYVQRMQFEFKVKNN
jgi:hypothetical protein